MTVSIVRATLDDVVSRVAEALDLVGSAARRGQAALSPRGTVIALENNLIW